MVIALILVSDAAADALTTSEGSPIPTESCAPTT